MSASTPETEQRPTSPILMSYWQKGVDDARAGLHASLERHLVGDHLGPNLDSWQRSQRLGGYLNGYDYGLDNKKAP